MPPFYSDDRVTVHHGDCLDVLRTLPDCSVDSVVTDPPYELRFMSSAWDGTGIAYRVGLWQEALRVLKPGGHLLAFGGTRTWHRLACAVEDAGFEIRDTVASLGGGDSAGLLWMHGQGFPKSLDVSRAIDKTAGAEREVVGVESALGPERPISDAWTKGVKVPDGSPMVGGNPGGRLREVTAPATEDAARWEGFGTALKPAFEPIVVARKPLAGTVAANVLAHGTGALNIAATRVTLGVSEDRAQLEARSGGRRGFRPDGYVGGEQDGPLPPGWDASKGRWPSNVVLTHSPSDPEDGCAPGCPVAELDAQSGEASYNPPARWVGGTATTEGWGNIGKNEPGAIRGGYGDRGGASRFFPTFRYQAKAPTRERPKVDGVAHPTVKPLALMAWLVRLVTPPGGVVLDPFAGSGATAEAAILGGFRCITIEREAEYLPLILERIQRQDPPEAPRTVAEQMSLLDDPAA